ncbi:hypothetical protein T479_04045 [Lysinibacillus varians]|nr:hypothetical protein T479_04045 [Lysinibacillus varians]
MVMIQVQGDRIKKIATKNHESVADINSPIKKVLD